MIRLYQWLTGCIPLLAVAVLIAGCMDVSSTFPTSPATAQQQAQDIEPILETAGFQSLPATTPEQMNRLKALPPLKLGYYRDQHGAANYWLADPKNCGCLLHGDEAAYQRYQQLAQDYQTAQRDRSTMMAQRYQQPPFGGPFGGGFGPPGSGFGFGFGPGTGFSPGMGFGGGGFQFSL